MRLVGPGGVLVTGPGHDQTQHGVPGKHDLHQEHKRLFGVPAGGSRSLSATSAGCPANSAKAHNGNSITYQDCSQVQHWHLPVARSEPHSAAKRSEAHKPELPLDAPDRREEASNVLDATVDCHQICAEQREGRLL